jgi:NAD(P)-dependent dehydrogenase (short-subunit alcohol dehydrogenase family)
MHCFSRVFRISLGGISEAAAEEASQNIRVNSIAPGAVKTELIKGFSTAVLEQLRLSIPLKKIGEAEDIAHLVLFLCSPAAGRQHRPLASESSSGGNA